MNGSFRYIAFYDLDHTILKGNSATSLVEEARLIGMMSGKQYRHAVWLSILYKLNLGDPSRMINRMLFWLRGLREDDVQELCTRVFRDSLVHTIRPEILETMTGHRRNGGAIVLLSSATTPICRPVSEHLKLDDVICTRLVSEQGFFTGETEGPLVYALEKKNRMHQFCDLHDIPPEEVFYYGDSYTDHHVMNAVGHPVAVSPDARLLKIALQKNWPVLVRDR